VGAAGVAVVDAAAEVDFVTDIRVEIIGVQGDVLVRIVT